MAHVQRVQGLGGDVDIVGLQFQVQQDQTDPTRFRQGEKRHLRRDGRECKAAETQEHCLSTLPTFHLSLYWACA